MSMWEPFTVAARSAMVRAQELVLADGGATIQPEHIVRGVIANSDDPVAAVLAPFVDRARLEAWCQALPSADKQDAVVFSREAKRAIEAAFEHARSMNHQFLGSAHLALGALFPKVDGSVAPTFARELDLQLGAIRPALVESLEQQVGKPLHGRWKYRIPGEEAFRDSQGLPLFLTIDLALKSTGMYTSELARGTTIRAEINEPGKAGPLFLDFRLD